MLRKSRDRGTKSFEFQYSPKSLAISLIFRKINPKFQVNSLVAVNAATGQKAALALSATRSLRAAARWIFVFEAFHYIFIGKVNDAGKVKGYGH